MTVTADQLRDLMALGLDGDKLVAVIAIFERHARHMTRDVTERDASRSPAAERAKRYRENKRKTQQNQQNHGVALAAGGDEQPVTNERDASRDGVTNAPLKEGSTDTEIVGNREVKKEVVEPQHSEPSAKPKRGARLADDWQPSPADLDFALKRGLPLLTIEMEATKFRNYWTNRTDKQAAKLDWSKAWQNWIFNVKGPANERTGQVRTAAAAGSAQTHGDAIIAGVGRYAARRFGGQSSTRDAGRTEPVRGRDDAAADITAERPAASGDQPALLEFAGNAQRNPGA